MIRIVIAEASEVMLEGIKHVLSTKLPVKIVGEATDLEGTTARVAKGGFDLLVLDASLAGKEVDAIATVRASGCQLPILISSPYEELSYARRALRAGALGYITKGCKVAVLLHAVTCVASGRPYIIRPVAEQLAMASYSADSNWRPHTLLSERESEVFSMLVHGNSITQIAQALHLSVKTVSTHKTRLMQRMEMKSLSEMVQYAVAERLIEKH